jgi:hypothetical protein
MADAMLDAAGHHATVFRVHALQVITDGQLPGFSRINPMQLGKMAVGDKAVFADIPVPGAHCIGGGQGQLQALLGIVLGLEAGLGALLQLLGELPALVGFNRRDQDPGDPAAFVADRAVGQVQPDFRITVIALQDKTLLAERTHLAGQYGAVDRGGEVLHLRPDPVGRLAEGLGVLVAGQQGEAIVVDLREFVAPQQQHRHR